jgi:AcrR family transcriptional regulator
MRVKTDQRRQAILDAAKIMFLNDGFERVSMNAIAASVGGSKATLYGYFSNKEEIFLQVMLGVSRELAAHNDAAITSSSGTKNKLTTAGEEYLKCVLMPNLLAARRLAISEATRSGIGREFYELEADLGWASVRKVFEDASKTGELKVLDSGKATLQFRSLLWAGTAENALFGQYDEALFDKIPKLVAEAVSIIYGYYRECVREKF